MSVTGDLSRRELVRVGSGLAGAVGLGLLSGSAVRASDRPVLPGTAGRHPQGATQGGRPAFRVDPAWPKPLPDGWVTGDVGGTAVDARDHLFIGNRRNLTDKERRVGRPAPAIIELDPEGNVVNAWTPDVVPDGLHGCFIDHEQNLWIAGNQDAIVQKYPHDGGPLLLQIGVKGQFDTVDGTLQGERLNASRTLLNRPADIAVDPANGDIYIADGYGNRRIVVFDRNGGYLRQWGEAATPEEAASGVGGKFLETVHAVVLGRDGNVYVSDRKGDRIQVFDRHGTFLRNLWIARGAGAGAGIGSAWDFDFSPDAAQTFIYNTNGEHEVLNTIVRETGEIIGGFGQPGHLAGEFTYLHTVAIDSQSNLYTGETIGGRRVQKFGYIGDESG
jgi:DNA-binding beta-propeller fold protein YncE